MKGEPVVSVRNMCKNFDGVEALKNVDFEVYRREIVGLVGDNGAGKSTLIKVITGAYLPDKGEIFFNGKEVNINSPRDSLRLGIEAIYQDLALIEYIDIPGNMFLGRELTTSFLGGLIKMLNEKKMRNECKRIIEKINIDIPRVNSLVQGLSGGQRKAVAIARAIYWKAKLLLMDEPTAALAIKEVREVLTLMKKLKDEIGLGIVFISHNLQEIFSVVDRITVLSRGEVVANKKVEDITQDEVAKLIIMGRSSSESVLTGE